MGPGLQGSCSLRQPARVVLPLEQVGAEWIASSTTLLHSCRRWAVAVPYTHPLWLPCLPHTTTGLHLPAVIHRHGLPRAQPQVLGL